MKEESNHRNWSSILLEMGKWILVLWLLLPLQRPMLGIEDFVRILLGILLFIVFAGKLLYDTLIDSFWRKRHRHPARDLFILVAIIAILAFVVGAFVVIVSLYLFSSWNTLQSTH